MKILKERKILLKIILIVLIVAIDLLTKMLFKNIIARTGQVVIFDGLLEFIYVENTGASWGIFSSHALELAGLSIVFLLVIIAYDIIGSEKSKLYLASFISIMGGGIGNLVDRLSFGYVRDFIGVANWFVCNVADIFVTVGVVMYLLFIIFEYKDKEKKHAGN